MSLGGIVCFKIRKSTQLGSLGERCHAKKTGKGKRTWFMHVGLYKAGAAKQPFWVLSLFIFTNVVVTWLLKAFLPQNNCS